MVLLAAMLLCHPEAQAAAEPAKEGAGRGSARTLTQAPRGNTAVRGDSELCPRLGRGWRA